MSGEAERHRKEIERLHKGMVVELDRRFTKRPDLDPAPTRGEPEVGEEVASTISVIRQVASMIGELQQTISQQEDLIAEQRQGLADLKRQKQTAYSELAEVERVVKTERERAERAESKLLVADAQIKRLEDYCASLKSHLNSLMAVVRDSLSPPEAATRPAEKNSA